MAAGGHTLGTIRGTIEIDYDGAGIVKAVRDTEKTKKSFGDLDGASSKVLGAFGKFAGGATKVAGAVNLANNAVHIVAGTIAAVGPIAAAAFATAPGVILAYVSVLGIAKIALAGVGDALKAAGGDSKKFDEAIKGLAPNAQKFARAFRDSLPALNAVKTAIQNAFFKGTANQVGGVVNRIASLRPQAVGVAAAMGQLVQNVVKTATSSSNIDKLRLVLSGVNAFLLRIRGAIGPVVTGFINLASQAGQFGGQVGGAVNGALGKLATFLQGINLSDLFAKAMPIIQQFGALFKTIGSIVSSVFGGISVDGAGAVGILGALATQLAAFLKSAAGQQALQALGTALQAISAGAGQIFLALLQALAPAIVALAPGVTVLAGQITGLLVPAITTLAPALLAVANFLSQNMSWLGPVAGAVVALAAAYKVWSAGATAVSAVQAALQSKIVTSTATWIGNTAAIVANRAAQVASAIATGATAVAAWVANTAAIVANRIALVAGQVAMLAVRGATVAWTAVQWLLNAALSANPIGLVVIAIAALVAGIIYAWKNSETFRTVVLAVWGAIKTAIGAVVSWITGTVWPSLQRAWQQISSGAQSLYHAVLSAWNSIRSGISSAINAVSSVLRSVWSAIVSFVRAYINTYKAVIMAGFNAAKAVINTVMNAAKAVVSAVWRAIVAVVRSQIAAVKSAIAGISSVVTTVRNAFNRAKSAVQSAISGVVSLVRSLPGKVSSALGGLGSLLYSKGQSLVRGFINGIASMIGAVASKAKSVVSAVTKYLPGSPAKTGPLSGKGYVRYRAQRFMNDFATGLNDNSHKPVAALMGTVGPIARAVVPTTSTGNSGVSKGTPGAASAGGTRTYHVAIGSKAFAELVVDAVTGAPVAVNKASNEGARKNAWAGAGR